MHLNQLQISAGYGMQYAMQSIRYLIVITLLCRCHCASQMKDGNSLLVASNNIHYEYMLHLKWDDGHPQVEFHWNDIVKDEDNPLLDCMLLHRVRKGIDPPTWLGFGIYPFERYGDVSNVSTANLMIGSEAIIGQVVSTE